MNRNPDVIWSDLDHMIKNVEEDIYDNFALVPLFLTKTAVSSLFILVFVWRLIGN